MNIKKYVIEASTQNTIDLELLSVPEQKRLLEQIFTEAAVRLGYEECNERSGLNGTRRRVYTRLNGGTNGVQP